MSLGDRFWGRKKKTHTDGTVYIDVPPGSRLDPKQLQALVDESTGQCCEAMASIIDAQMADSDHDVLNPTNPLMNIRAHRRLRQAAKGKPTYIEHTRVGRAVTLMIHRIVESATLDRGVIMVDNVAASKVGFRPGWDVKVSYAGRSVPMRLMFSYTLSFGEVELCRADIDDLGISDGASSRLMVSAIFPGDQTERPPHSEMKRGVRVPQRADEPDDSEAALDDSLPYEVETGWRPFKRWRRK
jgi:hypothetical protein